MEFQIYVPIQCTEPKDFEYEKQAQISLAKYIQHIVEHKFYQKTVRVSLGAFIKEVLEETGASQGKSSRTTRQEIVDDCTVVAMNAAKLFSFHVNPKCPEPAMFKINVEIRWDGEVKTTVEDCFMPKGFNAVLEFKFTTIAEFIKQPPGMYLLLIPMDRKETERKASYKIASIHPNITFIGSMFYMDYDQKLIVGYATLNLSEPLEQALEESGCTIWEKQK